MATYLVLSMGGIVQPKIGKSIWELAKLLKKEGSLHRCPEWLACLYTIQVCFSYLTDVFWSKDSIIDNFMSGKIDSIQFADRMCALLYLDSKKEDAVDNLKNAWNSMCTLSEVSFKEFKKIANFTIEQQKANPQEQDESYKKVLVITSCTNYWQYDYIKKQVEEYFTKHELFPERKDIWDNLIKPHLFLSFEQKESHNTALIKNALTKLHFDPSKDILHAKSTYLSRRIVESWVNRLISEQSSPALGIS